MSQVDRLAFALKHLKAADWAAFEELASAFLTDDFADLRTVAGVGDQGRDAVFESPNHQGTVVQYSIAKDWAKKIKDTIDRLQQAGVRCTVLIYVTNQDIGTRADRLENELLDVGVVLRIRDQRYFTDRVLQSDAKRLAAESLTKRVVEPLLPQDELVRNAPIDDKELKAGLLYIELKLHDSGDSHNLTRMSYDALVLAALASTDPDYQRVRNDIVAAVARQLPNHDNKRVESSVNGSLARLRSQKKIVFTGSTDAFGLHFAERERQTERALGIIGQRERMRADLNDLTISAARNLELELPVVGLDAFVDALDAILQLLLEQLGNRFAEAVRLRHLRLEPSEVQPAVENILVRSAVPLRGLGLTQPQLVELAIETVTVAFVFSSRAIQNYLRELADAYTHLAFMREAPDVQQAVGKFFSRGELVLDTTVLLPCIAETLLLPIERRFTNLLRSAASAGMSLRVTEGVLNEIETHLARALTCSRTDEASWEGGIPHVLHDFRMYGGQDFATFVKEFQDGSGGTGHIQIFLEHELDITLIDLDKKQDDAMGDTVRKEVAEIWRPRKQVRPGRDEIQRDILLRNDIEMFMGVLGIRRSEKPDVYGYEAWWVTLDGTAHHMVALARKGDIRLPSNPCMDPVFLTNMLAIGPSRQNLVAGDQSQIPTALDIQQRGWGSPALTSLADAIREEHSSEAEWKIRSRIRDAVNKVKASPHLLEADSNVDPPTES